MQGANGFDGDSRQRVAGRLATSTAKAKHFPKLSSLSLPN